MVVFVLDGRGKVVVEAGSRSRRLFRLNELAVDEKRVFQSEFVLFCRARVGLILLGGGRSSFGFLGCSFSVLFSGLDFLILTLIFSFVVVHIHALENSNQHLGLDTTVNQELVQLCMAIVSGQVACSDIVIVDDIPLVTIIEQNLNNVQRAGGAGLVKRRAVLFVAGSVDQHWVFFEQCLDERKVGWARTTAGRQQKRCIGHFINLGRSLFGRVEWCDWRPC